LKKTLAAILITTAIPLTTALMLGCAAKAHFYPVQGPLMSQTPLPVPTAKITYGVTPHDLIVTLPDGEVCKGHWTIVKRGEVPGKTDAKDAAASPMQSDWDTVFGPGYYVAHVLGTKYYARTTATGNHGSVLHVEIYISETGQEGRAMRGVAHDSRDNLYKLTLD